MIHRLHIKNFKSLKEIDLELSHLNLLTGLNGSGKSSLIQVLLLLRQSRYLYSTLNLSLTGNMVDIGTCKAALFNSKKNSNGTLYFTLNFAKHTELALSTYKPAEGIKNDAVFPIETISLTTIIDSKLKRTTFLTRGNRNIEEVYYVENQLKEQSLFNKNFQYLYTERAFKKDGQYDPNVSEVIGNRMLGNQGEHTAFYLFTYGIDKKVENPVLQHPKAKSTYLIDQVNAWLSEISPNVFIQLHLEKDKVVLNFGYENGDFYEPKNVGFGLSYVLPVIVALLTAEKGKLIIIENPESHIHPRGQAELGKLLAAAAQTEAQLIIETHSDHILNGIRVAVKEKPEIKDKVAIFFHDRVTEKDEQYSHITSIKIDEQGELSNYPTNFLDEWSNQLFKLV